MGSSLTNPARAIHSGTRSSPSSIFVGGEQQAGREWRRKEKHPSPFERKGGLLPVRHEMAHILRHSDAVAPASAFASSVSFVRSFVVSVCLRSVVAGATYSLELTVPFLCTAVVRIVR